MIKILADTSALVSLEIKHLVALSSKVIQFYISDVVRLELKEIAEFDDVHGRSAKDVLSLVDSGIIAVRYASARKEYLDNIDIGEAEILTLAESGEYDYMVTDDVRALPYIKSITKVKIMTSAFVIRILYNIKLLSRDEALNSIREISASRDWYGGVLEIISYKYFDDLSNED